MIGCELRPEGYTTLALDGLFRREAPDEIGRLLIAASKKIPSLDIRVLIWRSALAISATQGFFPYRAKAWFWNTAVRFALDDTVPFGACHHQKVVVIDDAVAFCGSADICGDRWDTTAHADRDIRRLSPWRRQHPPRHEVAIIASGSIAGALGDLARERWRVACGESAPRPSFDSEDPWPANLAPELRGTRLAIARTTPTWRGAAGVEEIARLTVAAIAGARRHVYMENQYFTSPLAAEALAARLNEPDGPEVVLITNHQSVSYFDRLTMDQTRSMFIGRLRAADVFGRLRVLAPFTTGGRPIIVHAKLMIVDETLAIVGSANLNNRSLGFDTECDLALEAEGDTERAAIAGFADALVAHWLGRDRREIATGRARGRSLTAIIDELNRDGRLLPIEPAPLGPFGAFVARFHLGDPASVADSWARRGRRERLYAQVRELMSSTSETTEKSTTSGK